MNQNMGKLLALLAVVGGLGAAYYFSMVKKDAAPLEHKVEEKKEEKAKAEAPKPLEEKKDAEEQKEHKAEEKKEEEKVETPSSEAASYKDDTVAAKIDPLNKTVTIKDVKGASDMLPPQMRQVPFETLYPILVRQAVDFSILEEEAKKEGFNDKEDVKRSIKDRERAIVLSAFLEKEVESKVSEDTLKAKYEELKKMIPADEKEYEVAHILLKDEAAAKALIKDIKDGKTTFDASLEKSLDQKTKSEGGKIGYLRRMEVAPDFFEKVSSTKDGDVVSTPLNLGKAASVIRVVSKRNVQVPEFEKVKGDIRKALMPELSMDILKKIKADAGLKLFNLEGKEIPERTEEELKNLEHEAPSSVDSSKLSPDFVCAEFKDGKITLKDVKASYDSLPDVLKSLPFEKIYELVLIRVINERVLSTAAEKSGMNKDQKVLDQIKVEKKLIVQEAYLKSKAEEKVSETDIKTEYQAIVKNMADKNELEYRIRHIATKTEAEAKDILKKLKSGEKFDDLVSLTIDEPTKDKKGEVGYVRKQQLPPEAGDLIAKATKGTLINQVIKFGDEIYSVVRVEDKRPVTPPAFEQVKDRIKNSLTAKKAVVVLEDLRSKYKIEYQRIAGLPTPEQIEKVVKGVNEKMNEVLKGQVSENPQG